VFVGAGYCALVWHAVCVVLLRARRRGAAAVGMLQWLWLGAVATWIALWSVTAGGTMGAL
jgi:hypothetical protein